MFFLCGHFDLAEWIYPGRWSLLWPFMKQLKSFKRVATSKLSHMLLWNPCSALCCRQLKRLFRGVVFIYNIFFFHYRPFFLSVWLCSCCSVLQFILLHSGTLCTLRLPQWDTFRLLLYQQTEFLPPWSICARFSHGTQTFTLRCGNATGFSFSCMHLFLSLFSYKCKCVLGHWNRSACVLWESDSQWGNQGCSSQPINRLRSATVLALWTGSLNHSWCYMSNNTAKRAALKTAQTSTVFLAGWMTQQQTTFWRFKLSKSATVPLGDWAGGGNFYMYFKSDFY